MQHVRKLNSEESDELIELKEYARKYGPEL
jgi:hypothetical protein